MANTLDQSYDVAEDASFRIGTITATGEVKEAQSFTPSVTGFITRITVKLAKNGSPVGNVVMTIEADSGGSPSGTPLATATAKDASTLTGSATYYDFDFSSPYNATSGVAIWYVLAGTYAQSDTDNTKTYGTGASGYAGGASKVYNNTSWSANAADLNFKEYYDPSLATGAKLFVFI